MSAFVDTAMDIVMEMLSKSTVLAGYYVKACGRKTLTSYDLNYCMKYTSRNFQSTPEFMEQFDSDSEGDIETVDEDDEPFVRYSGHEKLYKSINIAHDTWDQWTPTSPIQKRFKDAVNNIEL